MKKINVVCAVIYKNQKIYCVQRSKTMTLPLKWEFPGGKVEKFESHENALIREIKEELNCNIIIQSFLKKSTFKYDFGEITLFAYKCELINSTPIISEHVNEKWLYAKELQQLDWAEADIEIIDFLKQL